MPAAQTSTALDFVRFALNEGVLRFGSFKVKSGRISPYFFNAGLFNSGASVGKLAGFYAQALLDSGVGFDMLFGPAYKGIPLATATAVALAGHPAMQGKSDVPFAYNRKEARTMARGGTLVGAPLKGKVVIIDDVITAGTSVRESVEIIRAAGAEPAAVLIAMDRMERAGPTTRCRRTRPCRTWPRPMAFRWCRLRRWRTSWPCCGTTRRSPSTARRCWLSDQVRSEVKAGWLAAPCRCRRKLRGSFRRLPKAQPCLGVGRTRLRRRPGCIRELAIEGCQIAAGTNRQFDIGGVIRGQAVVLCQFVNGRRAFCSRWRVGQQG